MVNDAPPATEQFRAATAAEANVIIDGLGGLTKVSNLILANPSTVQSWRRNGVAVHHVHHIVLAAEKAGIDFRLPWVPSSDDLAIQPTG